MSKKIVINNPLALGVIMMAWDQQTVKKPGEELTNLEALERLFELFAEETNG